MTKYFISLIFCILSFLTISACTDEGPEAPKELSVQLKGLSSILDAESTCEGKADALNQWLVVYREDLARDVTNFQKSCPVGKKSCYQCMSHQLLASGRIEVALGECLNEERVKKAVILLNDRAGLNIGRLK